MDYMSTDFIDYMYMAYKIYLESQPLSPQDLFISN